MTHFLAKCHPPAAWCQGAAAERWAPVPGRQNLQRRARLRPDSALRPRAAGLVQSAAGAGDEAEPVSCSLSSSSGGFDSRECLSDLVPHLRRWGGFTA